VSPDHAATPPDTVRSTARAVDHADHLRRAIDERTARVGIIGLGYVGLPLSLAFTDAGFRVLGFDLDREKVESLAARRSYITHLATERVAHAIDAGRFEATGDFAHLPEADAILICVPTPLNVNREPDMSYVEATAAVIRDHLRPGQLVVLESTTYPGTTEEVLRPTLEESGLRCGVDFFLAYSPEREDPGNPLHSTATIPKVVGGVDAVSGDLAEALYGYAVVRAVRVSSARAAEASKLTENIFRAINIALVNELKLVYERMDIDVWEVLDAASTKPFGFMRFDPGPGWGGHCQDGDEFVFVRRDGGLHAVRMKELATGRSRRIGDLEVQPLEGVEVLSFDLGRQEICFREATHLFRRWYPDRVTIRTPEGRTLTATDGHPVIVKNGHGLEARRADAIGDGRPIVISGFSDPSVPTVDLGSVLRSHVTTTDVAHVEKCEAGWVYSLEVPGTETYVTSYGLVSHNCIPIDPYYLAWKAREYGKTTRFIELAGEINTAMPEHVVEKVAEALNASRLAVRGSRVLVLGLSYKPNVGDDRESPSYRLMDLLDGRGAEVEYHDPFIPRIGPTREHQRWGGKQSVPWNAGTIGSFDVVVISTDHEKIDYQELARWAPRIVDTRNAMAGVATEPGKVWKA